MAEGMALMVSKQIMGKVFSLLAQEVKLSLACKFELKKLEKRLKLVHNLINDASAKKKIHPDSVNEWLDQLISVASEADTVLDKFTYETLRRKVENRKRDKVKAFFSPSTSPLSFSHNMAHKIRIVNQKLDSIYTEGKNIGLLEILHLNDTATVTGPSDMRLTHRFIDDDSIIVGRDEDIFNVVEMLLNCDDDKVLPVLAIVGLGGQGKTTLAQLICKHEKVSRQFDEIIWVCVAEDFNVTRLLNEMVQSLTGSNPQLSNVDGIIKSHLEQKLSQRRYLLVLDDVWNKDEAKWRLLKTALMGISAARGSKILVTTRSNKVASTMESLCIHPLKGLSVEDSWNLFEKGAFAEGGPLRTTNLEDIGKEIVERCGGLPLAINVIGRVMYSKKFEKDWLAIQNSHFWKPEDDSDRVLQTLKLSYDQLPLPIKSCFSVCSLYVKDKVIKRNNLIRVWMALGLLQPSMGDNLLMEDVGDNFFNTLLSNYFLQDAKKDEYEVITSCKMHDLVHDLAFDTAKNGYTTLLSQALISNQFNSLAHLRVLVLENYSLEEMPDSIGMLIHLRYLDISKTKIRVLSSGITKLYNLQTLKVDMLESVPKSFGNLLSLRHFCMSYNDSYENCIFPGMDRLIYLQTIPFFRVNRESGCLIKVLGNLKSLGGDLSICGLEHVKNCEEARDACLYEKSRVRRLSLKWAERGEENEKNDENVLQGLEPHSNLQGLWMENFAGRKFPQWMMVESPASAVLRNLVQIKLDNCHKCEQIPPLGHLQHLKVVVINGMKNVKAIGEEFYGKHIGGGASSSSAIVSVTVFPALRELWLYGMEKLEIWSEVEQQSVTRNVFPCLKKLCIYGSSNLKTMPSHFPALTKLKLFGINNSVVLKQMSDTVTSLTSLDLKECKGYEFQGVLEGFLGNNRYLRELFISGCDGFSVIPNNLKGLEKLELWHCDNIRNIPCLPSAREVCILECEKVIELPDFQHLRRLRIGGYKELDYIPWSSSCNNLEYLELQGGPKIKSLPEQLQHLSALTSLKLSNFDGLESFPEWLGNLSSLQFLTLKGGPKIKSLPEQLEHLSALTSLELYNYDGLESLPEWLGNLSSLQSLNLNGGPKIKSLPEQLQHLSALTYWELYNYDGLESLPEWLGNLSSLQSLSFWYCKKLTYMPSVEAMRRLTKLNYLTIYECPVLEERCKEGSRPEWSKISHISSIYFNVGCIKKDGVVVMDGW